MWRFNVKQSTRQQMDKCCVQRKETLDQFVQSIVTLDSIWLDQDNEPAVLKDVGLVYRRPVNLSIVDHLPVTPYPLK